MRLHIKIWFQFILFSAVFLSCSKEKIDLNYTVEIISPSTEVNFQQLLFLNKHIGFIVGGQGGESGSIYKTIDGGKSWELNLNTDKSLYAINFLNDSVGYACGENLIVLKTYDQGGSWEDYQFPYYPGYLYQVPLKKIEFVDEKIIYLTGGMYFDRGLLVKSSNGGTWWDWDFFDYELSSSHFFSPDYGILSGYGHFTVTRDGADSFEVMDFNGDFFTAIYFLDEEVGFASGYDGGIYKTTTAGNNWEVLIKSNSLLKQRVHLNDLCMVNSDKGIVVGNNGIICMTYDGGNSWKKLNIEEKLDCYSIYHVENGEVLITCSEGRIIKINI